MVFAASLSDSVRALIAIIGENPGGPSNFLRTDIPKDRVPPDQRLTEGISYIQLATAEGISVKPAVEVLNEAIPEAETRGKNRGEYPGRVVFAGCLL